MIILTICYFFLFHEMLHLCKMTLDFLFGFISHKQLGFNNKIKGKLELLILINSSVKLLCDTYIVSNR